MVIRFLLSITLFLGAAHAFADTVVPTRTIRSQTILTAQDLTFVSEDIPGAYFSPDEVVGMEARVVLYAGRPIKIDDIGPPAIIERNQIVTLFYAAGLLVIATEARAMSRAGVGDKIRVLNLSSRTTVTGTVRPDGSIMVNAQRRPQT